MRLRHRSEHSASLSEDQYLPHAAATRRPVGRARDPGAGGRPIGLDIGATTWKVLLAAAAETTCREVRDDPAATVAELTDAITAIESDRHVVGCSFAGVLDRDDRVVAWPNRPSWEGFPIRAALADNGLDEILFADDGHCAAVGEHVYGAASGVTDFLCITVGTGVGSGLFVDGRSRVAVGRQPNGIGHLRTGLPVECRCGATGCVQAVLTADGMRPASWIDRVAETVADVAVLLNLSLVVLTGGRLLHEPQLAQALMSGLNRELRRADCAVRLSRTPDRSAVAGAYALAAEHAAR